MQRCKILTDVRFHWRPWLPEAGFILKAGARSTRQVVSQAKKMANAIMAYG
jgi:hypothetical protein